MTAISSIMNNHHSGSSYDNRDLPLSQDLYGSLCFLAQEERWGASQSSSPSPTCLSDFPSVPEHPAMTPLPRRASQTLWDPSDLPSAPICGGGVGSTREQQQQQQQQQAAKDVEQDESESEYSMSLLEDAAQRFNNRSSYGYNNAEPSISTYHQEKNSHSNKAGREKPSQPDYGYEDAAPDRAYVNAYGYEDAAPSGPRRRSRRTAALDKIFTLSSPDTTNTATRRTASHPRRFSSSPDHATRRRARRAGREKGTLPPTSPTPTTSSMMAPRPSSMKQQGQPRRASIHLGAERDVILPITGERVRRRSSITFDEIVVMQPVVPVSELTKNPKALWFQDEDVMNRREKARNLVQAVESGVAADLGMKPCMRGLEGFMGNHLLYKTALRHDGWDSVLGEQDNQIQTRTFDEEAVASVYHRASVIGHHMAAERAQQDAKDVESYLQSTRRMCRRLSC
jgi:hypothetical protein